MSSKIKPTPIFSVGDFGPGGAGAHVVHWAADSGHRPQATRFASEENGLLWRTDWRPPVSATTRGGW